MAMKQALTLTDAAADRVRAMLAKRGKPSAGIRIGVRSRGCSGLTYTLEYAKILVDVSALGADLVTLSAHKLGGPQGVGALVARTDVASLLRGGGQERGRRAGTENVPGIAGFGAAAAAVDLGDGRRMAALRDALETELSGEAVFFGREAARLPNTSCLAMPGVKAETQVIALDLDGVMVSAGAACSSGKVRPSHVLGAMGVAPELSGSAIRVSLGWTSEERDIERFVATWRRLSHRRRAA